MDLIEAFAQRNVEGIEPVVKTIDTQLSKVFIAKTKVYKVYKAEATFFGNFDDPAFRIPFYHEDFSWNQGMSPHVYLYLRPVAQKDGKFVVVSREEAEDYFIEMSLIDTESTISQLLMSKKLSEDDVSKVAKTFNDRIDNLTKDKKEFLDNLPYDWHALWDKRIEDIELFSLEQSFISESLLKRAVAVLRKHHSQLPYFKNYPKDKLSAGIDGHSDNIILFNDQITFLDILLVRERWRSIDPHFDICRLAADIEALGQGELIATLYNSSRHNPYTIPVEASMSYELSAACIKGIYNSIIGKNDLAKLYIPVIERLTKALEEK